MKRWVVYLVKMVGYTKVPLHLRTPPSYSETEIGTEDGNKMTITCAHEGRTGTYHWVRTKRVGVVVAADWNKAANQAYKQFGKMLDEGFEIVRWR